MWFPGEIKKVIPPAPAPAPALARLRIEKEKDVENEVVELVRLSEKRTGLV